MDQILADPTVRAVFIGVIVAFGMYLTALFRRLSKKLEEVAETTTATITLVDGQLAEVKGQLNTVMAKWEGAQEQVAAEKERAAGLALQTTKDTAAQVALQTVKDTAAQVALQTVKDTAAQVALQTVKDTAAREVQTALQAGAVPMAVVNGGGTQSVTVPAVTVPVHENPPDAEPPRIIVP